MRGNVSRNLERGQFNQQSTSLGFALLHVMAINIGTMDPFAREAFFAEVGACCPSLFALLPAGEDLGGDISDAIGAQVHAWLAQRAAENNIPIVQGQPIEFATAFHACLARVKRATGRVVLDAGASGVSRQFAPDAPPPGPTFASGASLNRYGGSAHKHKEPTRRPAKTAPIAARPRADLALATGRGRGGSSSQEDVLDPFIALGLLIHAPAPRGGRGGSGVVLPPQYATAVQRTYGLFAPTGQGPTKARNLIHRHILQELVREEALCAPTDAVRRTFTAGPTYDFAIDLPVVPLTLTEAFQTTEPGPLESTIYAWVKGAVERSLTLQGQKLVSPFPELAATKVHVLVRQVAFILATLPHTVEVPSNAGDTVPLKWKSCLPVAYSGAAGATTEAGRSNLETVRAWCRTMGVGVDSFFCDSGAGAGKDDDDDDDAADDEVEDAVEDVAEDAAVTVDDDEWDQPDSNTAAHRLTRRAGDKRPRSTTSTLQSSNTSGDERPLRVSRRRRAVSPP